MKNNEKSNKNEKEKQEDLSDLLNQSQTEKKPVAKDLVKLKHVKTKKQKVGSEAARLAESLKEQVVKHDHFEQLSNEELTLLEAFMGRRLFLTRIAIIVNQSRVPLGLEPFKKAELEKILEKLIDKGYIHSETVGDKQVFYLTERGKHRVQ
jgi:hypothetical protein